MCDCHRGLFLRRHASRTEASRNVPLWIVTKRLRADNITKLLTERLPIESIEIGLLLHFRSVPAQRLDVQLALLVPPQRE